MQPVWHLQIDARGHLVAFQSETGGWWYDLDGNPLGQTAIGTHPLHHLRIDARGHVVEVGFVEWDAGWVTKWYNLDGNPLVSTPAGWNTIWHLRLDARGHVVAVKLMDGVWYDLDSHVPAQEGFAQVGFAQEDFIQ
jgi:hypothetical protein